MLVAKTFAVSAFRNAWDREPRALELSLDQLVRALTSFPVLEGIEDKRALPTWCPARFREGGCRRSADVLSLSCMVLDLDDGEQAEVVTKPWEGWCWLLHSTWSHTQESPRLRLVLPLAMPVSAERWPKAWTWAARRTPGADTVCRDPARLYFRPAVAQTDQPRVSEVQRGPRLDLEAQLRRNEHDVPVPQDEQPRERPRVQRVPAHMAEQLARTRLRCDPLIREQAAQALGARLAGTGLNQRAEGLSCPACGRPSVWFYIAPHRATRARCHHLKSCGWSASLADLFTGGTP